MSEVSQFVRVDFHHFKAFQRFTLDLKRFNILVGPNNAGKSTILAAFRIMAAALRKANTRKAVLLRGPNGTTHGHYVDLSLISVAEENIFYNYDDTTPARIDFYLSNKHVLTLYFPEQRTCVLIPDASGKHVINPATFRTNFNCSIGFVPILGPVEQHEYLYEKEAARLALFNYKAARNFRNIWYHYPDKFDQFRALLQQTWPGLDIQRPEIDRTHDRPRLHMYCPEDRIPRELFWSGFGFQVWCQMLTHLVQSSDASMFLIDEPDIYLHSELQRQLLTLLRNLGPDILIATHSTEIITEAETDDIVLINKSRSRGTRIKDPTKISQVFDALGSNMNPVLTQVAKTRRVVFVEGKDFQIISKFARKLGASSVGNRRDFAVIPVEGFNPERIRNLKAGMETTLGSRILSAAVLDKDFRSIEEIDHISKECQEFCDFVFIHRRKEIENFLLVTSAIDRAAARKSAERCSRSGESIVFEKFAETVLREYCDEKKSYVNAQTLEAGRIFARGARFKKHDTALSEGLLSVFETLWKDPERRLMLIPGKEALSVISKQAQDRFQISITATAIIEAMTVEDIPDEMRSLVEALDRFSKSRPSS